MVVLAGVDIFQGVLFVNPISVTTRQPWLPDGKTVEFTLMVTDAATNLNGSVSIKVCNNNLFNLRNAKF